MSGMTSTHSVRFKADPSMIDDQPIMDASVRWYVDRYCAEHGLAVVGIPHLEIIRPLRLKPTLGPDPTYEEISANWPIVHVTFQAVPSRPWAS